MISIENNYSSAPAPNGYGIKPVDPQRFSTHRISGIAHNYHLHPLMQLDKLEELAQFMMERNQCRFVSPDIEIDSEFFHQSSHEGGKTISQVFNDIHQPKSWIALYNIEVQPQYKQFLHEVIENVRPLVEPEQEDIFHIGGFIFISAPPSVTPFHIDRENNFWLQILGQKEITVFDHTDRRVVSGEAVDNFIVNRSLDDVKLKQDCIDRGNKFITCPGDGVYFPSTSPHMTRTTEESVTGNNSVSISLGVVFYTDYTRRQARVHQCNCLLRRFGITPDHPATTGIKNRLKQAAGFSIAALKSKFRGYDAPPGAF